MNKHHQKLSLISVLSLMILVAYFLTPAFAVQYSCPENTEISISAPDDKMVDHVCNAADKAIRFLGEFKVYPQKAISVEITQKMIYLRGYWAFGMYDRQSDRIYIMSLPALLNTSRFPQMYNQPFDVEHYIGAIAHEIAHAIFHHNASSVEEKWNNAAQEYLAHATQLGVLSEKRRKEIINSEDTGPWESGDEISVTYMGFNVTGFAVKSYLHLTRMTDPHAFIQILLNHKWLYISVP